jgi:hypothetical protein
MENCLKGEKGEDVDAKDCDRGRFFRNDDIEGGSVQVIKLLLSDMSAVSGRGCSSLIAGTEPRVDEE